MMLASHSISEHQCELPNAFTSPLSTLAAEGYLYDGYLLLLNLEDAILDCVVKLEPFPSVSSLSDPMRFTLRNQS
jgi:hypothetical protein